MLRILRPRPHTWLYWEEIFTISFFLVSQFFILKHWLTKDDQTGYAIVICFENNLVGDRMADGTAPDCRNTTEMKGLENRCVKSKNYVGEYVIGIVGGRQKIYIEATKNFIGK